MFLDLKVIKKHLNLDEDFTEDDNYLVLMATSAEAVVQKHIDDKFENLLEDGELPSPLLNAMLLFIGNMYANRESVAYTSVTEVPKSYEYILDLYKNYNPQGIGESEEEEEEEEETTYLYLEFVGGSSGKSSINVPLLYEAKVYMEDGTAIEGYTIKYYINGHEYPSGTFIPTSTCSELLVTALVTNPQLYSQYELVSNIAIKTYEIVDPSQSAYWGYGDSLPTTQEAIEQGEATTGFSGKDMSKSPYNSPKNVWVAVKEGYLANVVNASGVRVTSKSVIGDYTLYSYTKDTGITDTLSCVIVKDEGIAYIGYSQVKDVIPSTIEDIVFNGSEFTGSWLMNTNEAPLSCPRSLWVAVRDSHSSTIQDPLGYNYWVLESKVVDDFTIKYYSSIFPLGQDFITILIDNKPSYPSEVEEGVFYWGYSQDYTKVPTTDEDVEKGTSVGRLLNIDFDSSPYNNPKCVWCAVNKNTHRMSNYDEDGDEVFSQSNTTSSYYIEYYSSEVFGLATKLTSIIQPL